MQIKEREADVARLTVRADRVEAELDAQRAALADAEDAVARERAVLQRRMAEIEKRESAERTDLDEAVRTAAEASGGRKGLLGRNGGKSVEELHNALRTKEAELQSQERRLSELNAALQRRESDLDTYARKLQRSAAAEAANGGVRPSDFTVEEAEGHDEPSHDDDDPTRKRLQFWSR